MTGTGVSRRESWSATTLLMASLGGKSRQYCLKCVQVSQVACFSHFTRKLLPITLLIEVKPARGTGNHCVLEHSAVNDDPSGHDIAEDERRALCDVRWATKQRQAPMDGRHRHPFSLERYKLCNGPLFLLYVPYTSNAGCLTLEERAHRSAHDCWLERACQAAFSGFY